MRESRVSREQAADNAHMYSRALPELTSRYRRHYR